MAEWRYDDVPFKLWTIESLTDVWEIGTKTKEKLNRMGVLGLQIFAHVYGIDRTLLCDKIG